MPKITCTWSPRAIRCAKKLTVAQAAERVRWSSNYWLNIERQWNRAAAGRGELPPFPTLVKIARALDTSVDQFLRLPRKTEGFPARTIQVPRTIQVFGGEDKTERGRLRPRRQSQKNKASQNKNPRSGLQPLRGTNLT